MTFRLTAMEVDGMTPWKTTFLYNQEVPIHFQLMCSSECTSPISSVWVLNLTPLLGRRVHSVSSEGREVGAGPGEKRGEQRAAVVTLAPQKL